MSGLEDLAGQASGCEKCRLSKGRTKVVFGAGNPRAGLMFVGEAPGFHEDRQGLPFVGAAGALLTNLLQGIELTREQVYIANVLKCRPPGNRDPMPDEVEACSPYLTEQIRLIDPRVICTLGNFATQLLLGRKVGISRVRGQRFDLRGRILVPTFHPAAILRGGRPGAGMAEMEEDFRMLAKLLGEAASAPPSAVDEDPEQLGLFS